MRLKEHKHSIIIFVIVAFAAMTFCCSAFAENIDVSIKGTRFTTGEPIVAQLSGTKAGNVSLKWTVAGESAGSGSSYMPTAADYESWIEVTAYDSRGKELASDRIYFSPLPVVYINTDDADAVIDRSNYVDGHMIIQGNKEYSKQYDGDINIKGRGTSSWGYDKKPYKLKLEKKSNLFGMGENKHYVLLANYLDPSLLRNTEAFRLARYAGLTSTDSEWVDVVLNGEFAGNYQLCEHIRVGEDRVDIYDWEDYAEEVADIIAKKKKLTKNDRKALETAMTEDLSWITSGVVSISGKTYNISKFCTIDNDISGGYLLELGSNYDDEVSHFLTGNEIGVAIIKPEFTNTNQEMFEFVRSYMQRVEDAICSENGYNSQGEHYTQLVDIDSIVSYWLVMEILSNEDAAGRSRFCYIDRNGKLKYGPVWDFDISSGSYRSFFGDAGWNVTGTVSGWYSGQDFWKEYVDDPYFQIKAREKYRQIRPYLEELIRDGGYIDTDVRYLYESGVANEMLWTDYKNMPRSFTGENGDVSIYKRFLSERIKWLDMVFATENSTTREMRNYLSSNPYSRSKKVKIEYSEEDAILKAQTPDASAVKVYINGILFNNYSSEEIKTGVIVEEKLLNEASGKANVINVCCELDGKTYTNYITVKTPGDIGSIGFEPADIGLCSEKHNLVKVSARPVSKARYGLADCWYCNKCHNYFGDADGNSVLSMDEVIISGATSDHPGRLGEIEKIKNRTEKKVQKKLTERFGDKVASCLQTIQKNTKWNAMRKTLSKFQIVLRKNVKLGKLIKEIVELF